MIAKGRKLLTLNDVLNKVSESDILAHYFGVTKIPSVINSPLREDTKPSFGLYSPDGVKINYKDFSTNDSGGIFDLLGKLWNCSFITVLERIDNDIIENKNTIITKSDKCKILPRKDNNTDLQVKIREWKDYDLEYWKSFGINKDWLIYAEVHPLSYIIIVKRTRKYIFAADKYAYCFVERKEGKVTLKTYQPFNTKGFKWCNKNDGSVIGLWTKVPEYGNKICICSSLKDALCLWANIGIPSIYLQGEGYRMSDTAINELKRRYREVFILFDNDYTGILDGEKLSEATGFINVVLPKVNDKKDISDLYKEVGLEEFKSLVEPLFQNKFITYK